jgi:predicted nucleic acid-binding protein
MPRCLIPKIVLDANCLIEATDASADAYPYLQRLFAAGQLKKLTLAISRHILAEVTRPRASCELANTLELLPYWPIGTIAEQVTTIEQLAGTWADAKQNQRIQAEFEKLAKSGNDIRDRGAYLDALRAHADAFVTSDRHLVGSGPARRIEDAFGLRVLTPSEAATFFADV